MRTTIEFDEWLRYFDPQDTPILYHMLLAIRDGNSYEPFCVEVDGEKMIISCSMTDEIRLLIASDKARRCFVARLNEFGGGDIELKYGLER